MGFNLRVGLHVAGLLLTVTLLAWCLLETRYYATMLTLTLLLVFQLAALLRYVSATNRELSRFLTAIRYSDFSQSFRNLGPSASFRDLGEAFDGVIERFRRERSGKEEQAGYLQAFVQQLPIAVLALDEDGRIPVANHALRRLLDLRAPVSHLRQVREFDDGLGEFISRLQAGHEQTFKLYLPGRRLHLKFSCTVLRSRGRQQKLISIQDIEGELEARELEAWQNLIRVMTHEIMNSVTPIASLAETADHVLAEAEQRLPQGTPESAAILPLLEDAGSAVGTISKRSQGLLRFVESYRRLTRLPAPQVRTFRVLDLLRSVHTLMQDQAARQNVELVYHCLPQTLELRADPELLEQALINLVRNAFDAVGEAPQPRVELRGELRELGKVVIIARDNGSGIDKANLENIFIPFFTTKRGSSGIGMSIVRQIARLHGGTVSVRSAVGEGTAVEMVL